MSRETRSCVRQQLCREELSNGECHSEDVGKEPVGCVDRRNGAFRLSTR
jgi:hypothetical protein